jgi:hypothetical protein
MSIAVKELHGVKILLDPDTGNFIATFSQGAENKEFARTNLQELEKLITQHVFPFSGHVEVGTAPQSPVGERTKELEEQLDESDRRGYYRRIPRVRPTYVLTGVQRLTRDRYGSTLVFRTDQGTSQEMGDHWVHPNPELDAEYRALAEAYLENQKTWDAKFKMLRESYKPFTSQEIVNELRHQGARTGRA